MNKMEVRGFCVQYSKRMNKKRQNREKDLQKHFDRLMNELKNNRSKQNISQLYCLQSELNKIIEYKTKGAIIRSRTCWHEGEKNTKYFLNLEKRQYSKTHITKLKRNGGGEITYPDEILIEI